MLRSLGETQRQLGIFGGGGDQLRAGTMFLATLYFALPLLGKSRPPLDFLSAESFRRAALHPARKKKKKKNLQPGCGGCGIAKFRFGEGDPESSAPRAGGRGQPGTCPQLFFLGFYFLRFFFF